MGVMVKNKVARFFMDHSVCTAERKLWIYHHKLQDYPLYDFGLRIYEHAYY